MNAVIERKAASGVLAEDQIEATRGRYNMILSN
jgi:hypothetical protein